MTQTKRLGILGTAAAVAVLVAVMVAAALQSPAASSPVSFEQVRLAELEQRVELLERNAVEQQHRIAELYAAVWSLDDHDHGYPLDFLRIVEQLRQATRAP